MVPSKQPVHICSNTGSPTHLTSSIPEVPAYKAAAGATENEGQGDKLFELNSA